jgi:GNAT superfamily N-acetyltransferase
MPVVVRRLRADQLSPVFSLPTRLHANAPLRVPLVRPLEAARLRAPVADGVVELYVAERDGEVVGTIGATRETDKAGVVVAWFGWFEIPDDDEVVAALIDTVEARARTWGAVHLRGPRNLTRFENMGLLVEGFDLLPPFLQLWHPPSYARQLGRLGFEPHHDVLAYDTPLVDSVGRARPLPDRLRAQADGCGVDGLALRSSSRARMRRDLLAAHEVLDAAFRTVPDVQPMPRRTWMQFGRPYLMLSDPRLLQLATVHGRPVGFAACFPELNEALVAMHGEPLPFGWLEFALALRHVRTASFKLIGVLPELRGTGVHARLIDAVVAGVREAGYHRLEASVIDERNAPMRAIVEGAGMTIYQRWRVFQRAVRP